MGTKNIQSTAYSLESLHLAACGYPHGVAIAEQTRPEIPMKRLGTCQEVAQLALFLSSDAAQYVTGQVWAIDGGRSLWGKQWPLPNPKQMEPVVIPSWPWEQTDEDN